MAYLPRHRLNRCSRAGSVAPRRAQVSSSVDEWPVLNFWFQLLIMSLGSQLSQTNPHSKWSWMCHWSTFRLSALEIRSIYIHIKSFTRSQWGDMVFFSPTSDLGRPWNKESYPSMGRETKTNQGDQKPPGWHEWIRTSWRLNTWYVWLIHLITQSCWLNVIYYIYIIISLYTDAFFCVSSRLINETHFYDHPPTYVVVVVIIIIIITGWWFQPLCKIWNSVGMIYYGK